MDAEGISRYFYKDTLYLSEILYHVDRQEN